VLLGPWFIPLLDNVLNVIPLGSCSSFSVEELYATFGHAENWFCKHVAAMGRRNYAMQFSGSVTRAPAWRPTVIGRCQNILPN
jgi:hypothetical protein